MWDLRDASQGVAA